ncbi:MAG: hypothetical protein WC867_05995 [Candidatus Pacearchaeota archaeon]|jgi:hypothetical protein
MSYIEDLWETFQEQPISILCTAFLIWAIFPVLIFALGGVGLLLKIISLETFTNLFANAIIPYWTSIILDFKKFIQGYIISFIVTLILVHHEVIKSISLSEFVEQLKNL